MSKHYLSDVLTLEYPDFLKVESPEPDWLGACNDASALVSVAPEPSLAEAFATQIRAAHHTGNLEREADIETAKGLVGRERLLYNPGWGGDPGTWHWSIDGSSRSKRVVNITITAAENVWLAGAVWKELVDSIQVTDAPVDREAIGRARMATDHGTPRSHAGVLSEVPAELNYLVGPAERANSLEALAGTDLLESVPEKVIEELEVCMRREMAGLSKIEARKRIRADREKLLLWLQQHPVEQYPESKGLYAVAGALICADDLFK